MTRPLHKDAVQCPKSRPSDGHAGLWFDKFCDQWRVRDESWTMKSETGDGNNPKLNWINTFTNGQVGTARQIDEYALRLRRLVERRRGRAAVFTTEARFVTGLGRSHPVENGFAWHPTLGTPYVPGSSVKGLVRSWAPLDAEPPNEETLDRLLGSAGKAGTLCFLDAVPTAPVRLEADVMTPHYAGWTEQEPPGDWRSPTPIPFLATAAETPFLFGIIACRPVEDGDLDRVAGWLRATLAWAGAGAKTAIGYGRFHHDDETTTRWTQRLSVEDRNRREEREQQEAMSGPEGQWGLKLKGLSEADILDLVRIHLEKEPLEDPRERGAFVQAVTSTGLVEDWRRGAARDSQTLVGKKKLKERARLIDTAPAESNVEKTN